MDAPVLPVEFEIARDEQSRDAIGPRPAQKRADARHQLRDGEGLDHIIVGADRKAAHAFALFAARRQHDDRQAAGRLPRAHAAADFQARHAGQHPVEDDEVGHDFAEPDLGLVAALDPVDDKAFGFEIIGEKQAQGGFVLDDENAGAQASSRRRALHWRGFRYEV